jgi:hypothetical protein
MGERVGVCPARRRAETAEQEGCRHLGRGGGGGGGGWIVIFLRGRERKAHQRRNARVLFGVQGDECTRPTTRETCIGLLLNKNPPPPARRQSPILHSLRRRFLLTRRCCCDGSQPRRVGVRCRPRPSRARSRTVGWWTLRFRMGSSGCSWSRARSPATRSLRDSWRRSRRSRLCPFASLALAGMCSTSRSSLLLVQYLVALTF